MTQSGLEITILAVLVTLATAIMFGLGFLYRPTRATLLWSLMFTLLTVGTFGMIVAFATGLEAVEDVAAGIVLGAPALVWSGLRAQRGARSFAWIAAVQAAASAAALLLTAGLPVHTLTYSLAYLGSTAMAALSAAELVRRPERGTGMLLPLTLVSMVLPVVGLASVSAALLTFGGTQNIVLPDVKAAGQVIYVTCALVSLLYLARFADTVLDVRGRSEFARLAEDRLARAAAAGQHGWSMLAVSLDDLGPLRVAVGDAGFPTIVSRFAQDVRASFPVDADIGSDPPHGALILLSRPDGVIRDLVRELLDRISTVSPNQPIAVEFSASVGWAQVRDFGHDVEALAQAAREAMERARAAGGNRWERAVARSVDSSAG